MNALTICQPYAHLIAVGEKPVENRTWSTAHRGELAIHAGLSREWLDRDDAAFYPDMVFGKIVAVAQLTDCFHIRGAGWPKRYPELHGHPHVNGPWCFVLRDVRRLREPVPCRGAQGIWVLPPMLAALVRHEAAQ